MQAWFYALECVVVPCAIGATMYGLFDIWNRIRVAASPQDRLPPVDYMI